MFEKSTTNYERKTTFCGSMTYFLRDERLPTAKEKQPLTSEKLLFTSTLMNYFTTRSVKAT